MSGYKDKTKRLIFLISEHASHIIFLLYCHKVMHASFVLFVCSDAYWHRQDHHLALTHHIVPAGSPRGWEAGVLYTHCARDGEGPSGAQRAGRLSGQVTLPLCRFPGSKQTLWASVWDQIHPTCLEDISRQFILAVAHNTLHQYIAVFSTPSSMIFVSKHCQDWFVRNGSRWWQQLDYCIRNSIGIIA